MENSFGAFLKEKRKEKQLTQKQLAEILFISESAVSKWEKDVAHPDITLLPKLAETLGVSEHELITASVDTRSREEKNQAKKWRTLSCSWSLFFYISYAIAIISCFICDLVINKTLSWFWIVFTSIILSFTFTNLPKLIKKHKLLILPASMYGALVLLLATCAIYTNGDWFFIAAMAVLFALIIVFVPIYISKYKFFKKIKKFNDFVSITIDFIALNILLVVIDVYSVTNNYSLNHWYFTLALPITMIVFLILNLFLSVRFLKVNRLFKTSIVLTLFNVFTYIIPLFIKVKNPPILYEIFSLNIFKANLAIWTNPITLERNIHFIIFLSIILLSIIFFIVGLIRNHKQKTKFNTKKST